MSPLSYPFRVHLVFFLCYLKENLLFHSLSCPFPLPLCSFGRDLRLPLQQQLMSRSPTRCGTWIVGPNSIASCHEEGALRLLYLDPLHYASSKDAQLTSMFFGKQGGDGVLLVLSQP